MGVEFIIEIMPLPYSIMSKINHLFCQVYYYMQGVAAKVELNL